MDKDNKKVALVTGGTGGLGTAMCRALALEGYRVVANYYAPEELPKWEETLATDDLKLDSVQGDVSNYESCEQMVKEVEEKIGPIDIVVNNAGITRDTFFHKMTPEKWNAVISTNLNSVFNVTRNVIAGMRERGFGRIINISSVNGQRGQAGQTNYSAAKAGIHGFTKSLAMETANKGITVNSISPGYIGTDMVMAIREDIRERLIQEVPVKRLGTPAEIADLVVYLASDKASYITGANHSINGGMHVY